MLLNAIIERDEYGYFAYVPSLEGCVSQGDTYEEALANIKEAAELYIESLEQEEKNSLFVKSSAIVPIQVAINA